MTNYYATIRGTLASAQLQEIFVITFSLISSSDVATVANSLSTNWQNVLNTPVNAYTFKNLWTSAVVFNEVTVAQLLNAEPPQPRLGAATHVTFTPIAGGSSGTTTPSQNAVAVSIKGGLKPNGVPQKGRMYLPCPATANLEAASGLLATGMSDKIRDCMASWWSNMNAAGHQPALWSRAYGTVKPWDSIRVGRTVDTIRRRRNQLPENYSTAVSVP